MEKVIKPWGWYEDYERSNYSVIKKIHISPNQRFSLQQHKFRSELWYILEGSGVVIVGDYERSVIPDDIIHVPKEAIHRFTAGEDGVSFIEFQRGSCYEDDITRLEDDYNRVTDGL